MSTVSRADLSRNVQIAISPIFGPKGACTTQKNKSMPLMLTRKSPFESAINLHLASGQSDPSSTTITFNLKNGLNVAAKSGTVCSKI